MPAVLVIQPDADDPPERLGLWLGSQGLNLRVIRPFEGDSVPAVVDEDALVVLGGDMAAWEVEEHPWLEDIKALLTWAVANAKPTLAICLGGQLLADALGGCVKPGDRGLEAGAVILNSLDPVATDPLFGSLPWPVRMVEHHRDAISRLPPGAVWLAESSQYEHQVFRVGDCAWGVQFHPEVSPETYTRWSIHMDYQGEAQRRVVEGVLEVNSHAEEISLGSKAMIDAFGSIVRAHARDDSFPRGVS